LQVVPVQWVDGLLNVCEVNDYYKWIEYLDKFILEGYSASQVCIFPPFCFLSLYASDFYSFVLQLLEQLHQKVVYSPELTDKQKSTICEKLAVSWSMDCGSSYPIEDVETFFVFLGLFSTHCESNDENLL